MEENYHLLPIEKKSFIPSSTQLWTVCLVGGTDFVAFPFPPPPNHGTKKMAFKLPSLTTLPRSLHTPPRQNPNPLPLSPSPTVSNRPYLPPLHHHFFAPSLPPPNLSLSASTFHRTRFVTARAIRGQEQDLTTGDDLPAEHEGRISKVSEEEEETETVTRGEKKELAKQGIWIQMKEIVKFTGPATGLWICGPLMSLIDTAVIGQGSSIELAALGIEYS